MIDSTTLASQTRAQASQTHNVRKCPVLSGPTTLPEETDASPDNQTTCAQNPFRPDRTSVENSPLPAWRPILRAASCPSCLRVFVVKRENQKVTRPALATTTPAQASQTHNVRKCPVLSGPTTLPEETDASRDSQTTCAPKPSYPDRTLNRARAFASRGPPAPGGAFEIPKTDPVNSPLVVWSRIFFVNCDGLGNRSVFAIERAPPRSEETFSPCGHRKGIGAQCLRLCSFFSFSRKGTAPWQMKQWPPRPISRFR